MKIATLEIKNDISYYTIQSTSKNIETETKSTSILKLGNKPPLLGTCITY